VAPDRNLLAVALDSIDDPILVHDKDFRLLRLNRAACTRLGGAPETLLGAALSVALARNGHPWQHCPYCEGAAGDGQSPDAALGGFLLASSSVFRDPAGGDISTIHVLRDVTENRQAELKYRSLFENVQEGVFVSTPEGRFLDFNEAFQRMLGFSTREELLGVDIAESLFLDPADREQLKALLARDGSVRDFEFPMRRRDGTVLVVSESSVACRDPFGRVHSYQGFVLDITARKQAELSLLERNADLERLNAEIRAAYDGLQRAQQQLLQSEKMSAVGQLISGVAHELNNPLTAILGYSQLLADAGEVTPRGAAYVDRLHRQAQRTHRIVQNLLSFARQHKPERVAVQLNRVLEDTLLLREYELRLNNIEIHRDFDPALPLLHGDPHQLQQVFLNILNNAVDAILEAGKHGEIRVRSWGENGRVLAEITDSGPGVAEAARVFDPFYTTKPVGKGTGLGLSICYGLVKEHGGHIGVRNAEPRGAAFCVSLPAASAEVQERGDAPGSLPMATAARILLVDDEETVLDLEQEVLRGRCLWARPVRSGREAIAFLEQQDVDLVVTDLKMPGDVSGEALYQWIAAHRPALAARVIFTMSDSGEKQVAALLARTGCPHLQKPFHLQHFLETVQHALAASPALL